MQITTYRSEASAVMRAASSNPAIAAALATVPDVERFDTELDRLVAAAQGIEPVRDNAELAAEIRRRMAAAEPLPDDLLSQVASAMNQAYAFTTAKTMLDGVAASIAGDRDRALKAGTDSILHHLNGQLTELLDGAGRLLNAPETADAAIATGRIADYEAAAALRTGYADIRKAQTLVGQHLLDGASFAHVRPTRNDIAVIFDPVAVWPDWLAYRRDGHLIDNYGNRTTLTPPWPACTPQTYDEHLWWLLRNPDAKPWVPTPAEFTARVEELRAQMAPPTILNAKLG